MSNSERVPVKTILATIALVVATYLLWQFTIRVWPILELILIAAFFALALNPVVDFCQRRLRLRRGLAITIVVLLGTAAVTGLMYLFVQPLVREVQVFVDRFPQLLEDARNGEGPVGSLLDRYNVDLDELVQETQSTLRNEIGRFDTAFSVAGRVVATIAAVLTIIVLAILMLLEGPRMVRQPLVFFAPETQDRIRKVAADASHSVTGYIAGNLLISLIAGTVTFVSLSVLGVPFAAVLAVWVAFADLIPLVGATLGAVPTIMVAFLHSTRAGIASVIVYVVYQQIENHALQPAIMSKTVKINPLMVLVSVLLGVRLAGLLGALIAIPVAGVVQVVGRDIFDHRRGRLKGEPTVGEQEVPAKEVEPGSLDRKEGET